MAEINSCDLTLEFAQTLKILSESYTLLVNSAQDLNIIGSSNRAQIERSLQRVDCLGLLIDRYIRLTDEVVKCCSLQLPLVLCETCLKKNCPQRAFDDATDFSD